MTVKCFARLEIRSNDRLGPHGLEFELMQGLVRKLGESGLECTSSDVGCFCVYTLCRVDASVVSVALLAGQKLAESHIRSSIWCSNHLTGWRRLLKRPSAEWLYSGAPLTRVCDEVAKALALDPRISQIQWMAPHEWHKLEKSQPHTSNPETVEDWLPAKKHKP